MAALTAAIARDVGASPGPHFEHFAVTSAVQVFAGGAYAINNAGVGLVVVPSAVATDQFCGIAQESVLGDGTKKARFLVYALVKLDVVGVADNADIGLEVFATGNDNTFNLTGAINDIPVGFVHSVDAAGVAWVLVRAAGFRTNLN